MVWLEGIWYFVGWPTLKVGPSAYSGSITGEDVFSVTYNIEEAMLKFPGASTSTEMVLIV
jgi:hypothetical protein